MRDRAVVLGLVLLVACGGTSDEAAPADPAPAEAAPATPAATLAERVAVDRIEILQGTTTVLVSEGAVVAVDKRNAPVIVNRPSLVRVHAIKLDRPRLAPLVAELRLHRKDQEDVVVADTKRTLVDYDPGDITSTWNFELAPELVTPDARIEVTLRDPAAKDGDAVVYPPLDQPTLALAPRTRATTLRVKLVPIKYNADQSGRVPVLDDRTVEQYRRSLYKMYPASVVEVSVREPLPWAGEALANGDGWDQMLTTLMSVRRAEYASDDLYYVGVFEPAPSLEQFCGGGGCVLGIAPQAGIKDVGMHVALITGYGARGRNGTLAQELAHSMGRGHAPCGNPAFPDPDYPYANARIGVAGWDVDEKTLLSPTSGSFDFMSYCSPVWVSDFTWTGISQRMLDTADAMGNDHLGARVTGPARAISVDGKGVLSLGPEVDVRGDVEGDTTIEYEDASGARVGSARGAFRRYDNIPGGILVAPEPPAGAKVARVPSLSARALPLGSRRVDPIVNVAR